MLDLSDTLIAKSDQLNAEDLISADRTIVITKVHKYSEKGVAKFDLHYEGDQGRVYKPSKGMRVAITSGWGTDGDAFIGKSLRLYYDPEPVYAGKEVGGIRINGMSDIRSTMKVRITERRGVKKEYVIERIDGKAKPAYPVEHFNKVFDTMAAKIAAKEMTPEQVINKCEATGYLSDEQKNRIRDAANINQPADKAPEQTEQKVEKQEGTQGGFDNSPITQNDNSQAIDDNFFDN